MMATTRYSLDIIVIHVERGDNFSRHVAGLIIRGS